jgi:membrane protease YdiL (CAAX protease family)
MLPEKPWKIEAILRLGASVVICIFLGTLIVAAIQYFEGPMRASPVRFWAPVAGALGTFSVALFLLRRPWSFENFTRRYVSLVSCFFAGLLLTGWALKQPAGAEEPVPSTLQTVVALLGFQGAALLLISRFLREHGISWSEAFGFKINWPRAVVFGLICGALFVLIGLRLQFVCAELMEHLHVQPEEQTAVKVLRNSETFLNGLVLGIATVLLAPVAEEMIFRGVLYPAIKQRGFPRLALWGTSIAFGAIHFNLAALLPLIVLALILTELYEKTGNLLGPIVAHSLFNALNFALVYIVPNKMNPSGSP